MRKHPEPRAGRAPALSLACALALAPLPCAAAPAGGETPGSGPLTGRDLKAIHYVENAHGQLEEWSERLLARLERGLGPRDPEPILDGRADLQTAKIRVTYAGYVDSPRLAALFRALAAAHVERLEAVRARLAGADGSDGAAYRELDARVAELITRIRNWRTNR